MNDKRTNISCNTLKLHGLHYIRRSMAERMISELSDMSAEIQKNLGYGFSKKTREKYIYARPSKEQMEVALATLLDSEEPAK